MKINFISAGVATLAIVSTMPAVVHATVDDAVTSPIHINNTNEFVPASFTHDGNPMLSFTDFDNKEGSASVQILDASISPVTDFLIPANPNTATMEKGGRAWRNMYWESVERDTLTDYDGSDVEKFLAEKLGVKYSFIAKYCIENGTSAGEVYGNEDSSFEIFPSDIKVIKRFAYRTDKYLIDVKCSGKCDVYDVLDATSQPRYNIPPLMSLTFLDYDKGASSIGNIAVTQTLFNEDTNFEYISPIYESVADKKCNFFTGYVYDFGYFAFEGEGIDYVKPSACTGFSIINQNGETLQTVEFENGFKAKHENFMSLLTIGNKAYLSCNLVSEDNKSYTVLYEVNKANSGIKNAGMFKASVYPTLISRGENVTVDLGEIDDNSTSVSVSDAFGRMIYQSKINAGEKSISIPSQKMSTGLNIVTVNNESSGNSSTKILVK